MGSSFIILDERGRGGLSVTEGGGRQEATRHTNCAALCSRAKSTLLPIANRCLPQCGCCLFPVKPSVKLPAFALLDGDEELQRYSVTRSVKMHQKAIVAPQFLFCRTVDSSLCLLQNTHTHSSIECSCLCIVAGRRAGGQILPCFCSA